MNERFHHILRGAFLLSEGRGVVVVIRGQIPSSVLVHDCIFDVKIPKDHHGIQLTTFGFKRDRARKVDLAPLLCGAGPPPKYSELVMGNDVAVLVIVHVHVIVDLGGDFPTFGIVSDFPVLFSW